MNDQDLLDNTWRAGLARLAPDIEPHGARERAQRRYDIQRRRHAAAYTAVSVVAAAAVAAGVVAVARDDKGANVAVTTQPPATAPVPVTAPGGGVDAIVHVSSSGDVVTFTSGPTTNTPAIPVRPGTIDVWWDGDDCTRRKLPCPGPTLELELPDGRHVAPGNDARISLPKDGAYLIRIVRGDALVATGEIGVKVPGVNPPTPAAQHFTITAHKDEPLCGFSGPRVPTVGVLFIESGTYAFSFANSHGRGPFMLTVGTWAHSFADGSTTKVDLPVGHYEFACPGGGTVPVIVGE